jgi:hypothetical protein
VPAEAGSTYEERWIRLSEDDLAGGKEIEEPLIAELVARHTTWIARFDAE